MISKVLLYAGVVLGLMSLTAGTNALAQTAKAPAKYKVPRTADGHPDLQGNWTNATLTQVERDPKVGERQTLTAEEAAAIEGSAAKHVEEALKPTDPKLGIKDLPHDCGYGFTGDELRLQQFLGRSRHAGHQGEWRKARIDHRRSAEWQNAGVDAGGPPASGRAHGGTSGRRSGRRTRSAVAR